MLELQVFWYIDEYGDAILLSIYSLMDILNCYN